MSLQSIFNRVANWNEARYPRQYSKTLTSNLIEEEYKELCDAKTPVDELDALCDIVYVSYGALWKLGVSNLPSPLHKSLGNNVYGYIEGDYEAQILSTIADSALYEMKHKMMLDDEQVIKALSIVCDSNDSKHAKMTDPTIKANIDKGASFVAPEPRLQQVLGGVELWKI